MTNRSFAFAGLLAVLCLMTADPGVRAQQPPQPEPVRDTPTAVASAPVRIRITAIVTDRRGRALVDLKPTDFTLDDNGVGQSLASVELKTVPRATADPAPVVSQDDERKAARDPETRVFAIFLDEFNVSPGVNSARVRDAALQFLTEQVRPADLVIVLKPMDPVTGFRFTRDRAAARTAIASFEGRKGDYTPRTSFETQYLGRTPGAVESARTQIVTTGLRELLMTIGELQPARGAVVLISEGFVRAPGGERRRLPDWQSLSRAASHFNLPIYTLDPRDPAPPSDGAATKADPAQDTLQALARQTGGESVTDARELAPGLARLSRDLDAYYVLTYQPSQASDGRFHPIVVTTKRKDAQLRVPSGYWSPLSSEWRTLLDRASAPPAPSGPARTLRRSRVIDTWYGFERGPDGRLSFVFTWETTAVGAALRAQPRVVTLKASTPQGAQLFEREIRAVAPPGQDTPDDRAVFQVSPGRLQLDLSVRAADGTVIDTSAQDIDVPFVRGAGPVILQPQLVRARTARDYRALVDLADAAPSPSRVFSRSERLLLRVPAYNPDGAPVTIAAAVSNTKGVTIRPLEQTPPLGATSQFDLPLAFLAPGEYGIEVTVTSPTGTARQLIRFRLVG